jgi:hypothetical protein
MDEAREYSSHADVGVIETVARYGWSLLFAPGPWERVAAFL